MKLLSNTRDLTDWSLAATLMPPYIEEMGFVDIGVAEHWLNSDVACPFFHASNDSSSQIDYFLIAISPGCLLKAEISIPDMHYLNTSGRIHLELRFTMILPNPCQETLKRAK